MGDLPEFHPPSSAGPIGGIGRSLVEALLEAGAKRVYAGSRRVENLAPVIALDPSRVVPLHVDVTDRALTMALADKAGDVDLLVNNAGDP